MKTDTINGQLSILIYTVHLMIDKTTYECDDRDSERSYVAYSVNVCLAKCYSNSSGLMSVLS